MKILVVDDDFASRRILMKCAARLGDCDMAANGREALEAYESASAGGAAYDLILLDIMMPELNGSEVLRLIRAKEDSAPAGRPARTLIAMATSLGDKDHVFDSFREQCDGYILKPYSPESVLRDLRRAGIVE